LNLKASGLPLTYELRKMGIPSCKLYTEQRKW